MKRISVIVPVFGEEQNLPRTVPRLIAFGSHLKGYELELVFVDDGSRDRSLPILVQYQKQHPATIVVVKLARNFGAMAAVQAGLSIATGDCVGAIDADLQDDPGLFLKMIPHWEKGMKAIFAVREDREEPLSRTLFSGLYYRLLRRFAIPDYPEGGFDVFLVDKQVVDEVNRIGEKNTNIMSLIFWLGFEYVAIPSTRKDRVAGESKWSLARKVKLFIDSFAGFSQAPIRLIWLVGALFVLLSGIWGGYTVAVWRLGASSPAGFEVIGSLVAIAAGLQMIMLGIIGEYVWRILEESRKRPLYVIDRIFRV